jgi:hypothetical protein
MTYDPEEIDDAEVSDDEVAPKNINGDISLQNILPEGTRRRALLVTGTLMDPPKHYREIAGRDDAASWYDTINVEMDGLEALKFADLISRPPGVRGIRSRLIFEHKVTGDKRCRLVAMDKRVKGQERVHSPVATDDSFRLFIAKCAEEDLELEVIDVRKAYLKAEMEGIVYLDQPEGAKVPGKEDWVYRLNKALYGMRIAGKLWNKDMDKFLKSIGFTNCNADACVYKGIFNGESMYILVHVDDFSLACKTKDTMAKFKSTMDEKFGIKDLGAMKRYLAYQVNRDRMQGTITLHQSDFISEILNIANMTNCAPSKSKGQLWTGKLTTKDCTTTAEERAEMEKVPYRQLTGALQHLATHTRPDISFEVATLSRFNNNPGKIHWLAMKQLLRFLKHTHNDGLRFKATGNMILEASADAGFAQCVDTGRSAGGYVVMLGENLVSWKSKWFQKVHTSSTETEFASLYLVTIHIVWLRKMMDFLGYPQHKATIVHEDNQGTIRYSYSEDRAGRMKHVDTRMFLVREKIQEGFIQLSYIPTKFNKADITTKSLRGEKFELGRKQLGMTDIRACLAVWCKLMDGKRHVRA